MFVGMWMTRDLLTVAPTDSLGDLAVIMARKKIRRLPVVRDLSAGKKLLGIVSYSDVLHAFPVDVNPFSATAPETLAARMLPGEAMLTAADVMQESLLTATAEMPIEHAALLMRNHKVGALPVMKGEWLEGLITESDIFRAFADLFESSSSGVRVTFDMSRSEDIFSFVASTVERHRLQVITFVTLRKHARPVCVAEVAGKKTAEFVEAVWKSGHSVLNVIPVGEGVTGAGGMNS